MHIVNNQGLFLGTKLAVYYNENPIYNLVSSYYQVAGRGRVVTTLDFSQ